jgi:nuclear protein localization family protein 4
MLRITAEPSDTFAKLGDKVCGQQDRNCFTKWLQLLEILPANVDPKSITLSPQPSGGNTKFLYEIAKYKISQIGLR